MNDMKQPHKTGDYNPKVDKKNKYETALEKAIINNTFSIVDGEKIDWLDGELPVEAKMRDKAKYKRLDLLGLDSSGNYVLCELKFSGDCEANEGNGDPSEAEDQLKEYADLLKKDIEWFRLHKKRILDIPFNRSGFSSRSPRLMVVTDEAYWKIWCEKNARRSSQQRRSLDPHVEHYSIAISSEDLDRQKNTADEDDKYRPILPSSAVSWKRVENSEYDNPDKR